MRRILCLICTTAFIGITTTTGFAQFTAPVIQWQKCYGGNDADKSDSYQKKVQTPDGGYMFVGYTKSNNSGNVGPNHGDNDSWVVRLNDTGSIIWQKCFGGDTTDGGGSCLEFTADGGAIIVVTSLSNSSGDVGPNHGSTDIWVYKIDSVGNLLRNQPLVFQEKASLPRYHTIRD